MDPSRLDCLCFFKISSTCSHMSQLTKLAFLLHAWGQYGQLCLRAFILISEMNRIIGLPLAFFMAILRSFKTLYRSLEYVSLNKSCRELNLQSDCGRIFKIKCQSKMVMLNFDKSQFSTKSKTWLPCNQIKDMATSNQFGDTLRAAVHCTFRVYQQEFNCFVENQRRQFRDPKRSPRVQTYKYKIV